MDTITLQATETVILRGRGQYNKGDKAVFSIEDAATLIDQFPDAWREVEDATLHKAPAAPPANKMVKQPGRKK